MADEAHNIVDILEQIRNSYNPSDKNGCENQSRVFLFRPTTMVFRSLSEYYRYHQWFRDLRVSSFFTTQTKESIKEILAHDSPLIDFLV